MLTITKASLAEMLYSIKCPSDWFIREPFQDAPPIYMAIEDALVEHAQGLDASAAIWNGPIIAQWNDKRTLCTLVACQETEEGFSIVQDAKHLHIVAKHIVFLRTQFQNPFTLI